MSKIADGGSPYYAGPAAMKRLWTVENPPAEAVELWLLATDPADKVSFSREGQLIWVDHDYFMGDEISEISFASIIYLADECGYELTVRMPHPAPIDWETFEYDGFMEDLRKLELPAVPQPETPRISGGDWVGVITIVAVGLALLGGLLGQAVN